MVTASAVAARTAVVGIAATGDAGGAFEAAEGNNSGERPVVSRPLTNAVSPSDVLEADAVMPVGC